MPLRPGRLLISDHKTFNIYLLTSNRPRNPLLESRVLNPSPSSCSLNPLQKHFRLFFHSFALDSVSSLSLPRSLELPFGSDSFGRQRRRWGPLVPAVSRWQTAAHWPVRSLVNVRRSARRVFVVPAIPFRCAVSSAHRVE